MIKKQFTLKTPIDIEVKFDLIDTEYWLNLKKEFSYSIINWELFHYRNDCPAYLLDDGRVVHKYFYDTFLHLYDSIEEFLKCFQKGTYYFFILYYDPKPELFYYGYDVRKVEIFNKKYHFMGEEDEFHKGYLAEKEGSIKYLYKPHENRGLWFENIEIFNKFLPYYKGEI